MIKPIFGKTVRYWKADLTEHKLDGYYDYQESAIFLHNKLKGDELKLVMLHEEFHAIMHRLGLHAVVSNEIEELIVENFSTFVCESYELVSKHGDQKLTTRRPKREPVQS
jgi:hypothetical protein